MEPCSTVESDSITVRAVLQPESPPSQAVIVVESATADPSALSETLMGMKRRRKGARPRGGRYHQGSVAAAQVMRAFRRAQKGVQNALPNREQQTPCFLSGPHLGSDAATGESGATSICQALTWEQDVEAFPDDDSTEDVVLQVSAPSSHSGACHRAV